MTMTLTWSHSNERALELYLDSLVNHFFKILPMREEDEPSLQVYVESLQVELVGCNRFLERVGYDPQTISLLAILQYFSDNPDAPIATYKREVFKCISICNKLKARHQKQDIFK